MSETITKTAADVTVQGLRTIIDKPGMLWLDLDDPMSTALDELAERYGWHELAVEDCRHATQLAKADYYEGYTFIIINSTHYTELPCELRVREIDVFLGPDYIVTVHYNESLSIKQIERWLTTNVVHLERPDQALHSIIDIVVDRYLPTLESIGDTIDKVQDDLLISPEAHLLQTIFELKRGMLQFRRAVSSQRELLNILIRDDTQMISKDMRIYFRDVYDHAVRAMDLLETYRDLLTGGLDIYLTQMANRTNDIVKGLTILATIMLPLTLLTGYFGMNFEYIPLLKDPNGIWYTTAALIVISVSMLVYFKYKRWI
ncbi:MAG TPA: magnesium/cobalt transporter CorA [Blastocatellia bacterium]|nr:magnesium/cobalt transporter CorA [Blastocatellia bacterium]